MSKTPRTDEHLRMKEENGHAVIVSGDFARQLETELADKDKQLAEARAEIERLSEIAEMQRVRLDKRNEEIERKDKLIEQMREALKLALPEARSTHCENVIKAALAAERGEGI